MYTIVLCIKHSQAKLDFNTKMPISGLLHDRVRRVHGSRMKMNGHDYDRWLRSGAESAPASVCTVAPHSAQTLRNM